MKCSLDIINISIAAGTLVAAFTAVIAIYLEGKRSRFSLGVDTILNLDDRFNDTEMRQARLAAAKSILDILEKRTDKTNEDVEEVLDFFETVGLMTHKGALDDEMVWNTFFYYLHPYCCSADEYIKTKMQKEQDSTIYQELMWLDKRIVAIDKRKRGGIYLDLSKEQLKKFLEEEANLHTSPVAPESNQKETSQADR